ncbi:MAG TPA: hypothetical protein VHC72_05935, partial [Bryobacteraceae bacterium]|nr:hypothetical protein [Bryobacteraceae bacterium]
VEAHLAVCPACAAEVDRTTVALALFRQSGERCAEYWEQRPAQKPSRAWRRWGIAALVMAAVVFAVVLMRRPAPPPVDRAQTGFVRIPYVVPPLPYERTEIVHMNVPVAALIAVGFQRDEPAAASVPAEVLVGQDDRPLAIRVLE